MPLISIHFDEQRAILIFVLFYSTHIVVRRSQTHPPNHASEILQENVPQKVPENRFRESETF
jgi:hypothetical protein